MLIPEENCLFRIHGSQLVIAHHNDTDIPFFRTKTSYLGFSGTWSLNVMPSNIKEAGPPLTRPKFWQGLLHMQDLPT